MCVCVCVWLIWTTLWSNIPTHHFAYINNLSDILTWVTNQVISALLGTLNIAGVIEKYFLLIVVSHIY